MLAPVVTVKTRSDENSSLLFREQMYKGRCIEA